MSGFASLVNNKKKARKFYEIPEDWTESHEMLRYIQDRMGLEDSGMENLSRFTARTAGMESDFRHWAINPESQASGMYQFIESPANNSVTTAIHRAMANYDRNNKPYPNWLMGTPSNPGLAHHKEILKLTPEQQTTLFLANIGEADNSDPLIRRVHAGDEGSEKDLYAKMHYRGDMDDATKERMDEWYAGAPQGQNTWPKY